MIRAVQVSLKYPVVGQVADDEEVLRIDFEHVQHIASSGVYGVNEHDCVAPSFLDFEVVAVDQYFKLAWPAADCDVAVREQRAG